MSMVLTDNANYTAIANAIREKNGLTDTYKPNEMADAIAAITTGGGDIPDEAFVLTGDCSNRFASGGWDWFVDMYGDKITTEGITNLQSMFHNSKISKIPFDIHCDASPYNMSARQMFYQCSAESIGDIYNLKTDDMNNMFYYAANLKELPNFIDLDMSEMKSATYGYMGSMFQSCCSLRRIPEDLLAVLDNPNSTSAHNKMTNSLSHCYALDTLTGIYPTEATITSNMFSMSNLSRVRDITFKTNDDGTPYVRNWKSQNINLYEGIGAAVNSTNITTYAKYSGVDVEAVMKDDASYQLYKDNPDAWTYFAKYSRYNHNSAVNTINSLPDTSAYLATAGGTNTIRFNGNSGSATDGGAINTLTEEEIAVAAAKGWTVSF